MTQGGEQIASNLKLSRAHFRMVAISYLLQKVAEHRGVVIFVCTQEPCDAEPSPPLTFTVRF